jgi:arylsulfatase A-like enzyme
MLSLLLVYMGCSPGCSPSEKEPDVVLVIIDTLRADALGFSGSERDTSPNLDALTAEFTWFSRAYSTSSWTLPATASILTGLHPFEHRVVRDGLKSDLFGRLDPTVETLAQRYKKKGYRTGAFINNAYLAPDFGLNQGFETYDYQGAGPTGHRTAMTTVDQALAWLNAESEPAFLFVHIMEPHADYEPAEAFRGRFTQGMPTGLKLPLGELVGQMIERRVALSDEDKAFVRAAYDEEVLSADAAIGALVSGMRKAGRFDRSTMAITSDHGEEFWEFGGYEHGHSTMTPIIQVPLMLKAPDVVPGENATVVSLVSLFAALGSQSGPLMDFARRGVDDTTQIAMSEDILYGPPQISVISNDLRLQINPTEGRMTVFELDESGRESIDVSMDPQRREHSQPLHAYLKHLRAGSGPIKAFDPIQVQDFSDFEKLRALGYVE